MNVVTLILGPLVVPESLRSARRGWIVAVRTLAGLILSVPAMIALWWWWMRAEVEPSFRSDLVIPLALDASLVLAVTIALLLGPAVLAGSLAGDRERGSIGLLLSTRVDAREIVLGRLFGKLTAVFAMILAGWPFLILFAVLRDLSAVALLAALALPFVVAFGAGGLAIATSSVARRGWSALMTIYVAEVLLLLIPLLGLVPGFQGAMPVLGALNPYPVLWPFVHSGSPGWILGTLTVWFLLGVLGSAFASWRLRPSFLASVGGKARGIARRRSLPPVDESRPMLWKELNIDRGAVLGWFGRALGIALFLFLAGGSVAIAATAIIATFGRPDLGRPDRLVTLMDRLYVEPAEVYSCFLQLAVGLRAAVGVASERERGTWEALLTSPLTGREILWGKLRGSLHSLRWLFAAVLLAWGLSLAFGAMTRWEFIKQVGQTLVVGTFTAAVGVRASIACGTATKAMSVTVGVWLAALLGFSLIAAIAALGMMLLALMAWMVAGPLGLVSPSTRPWASLGSLFEPLWYLIMGSSFLSVTSTIVGESWARFDAICGRMAGDGHEHAAPVPVYEDGSPVTEAKSDGSAGEYDEPLAVPRG